MYALELLLMIKVRYANHDPNFGLQLALLHRTFKHEE